MPLEIRVFVATYGIDEMANALGVAVSDVCWPFAIIMVQSGGDMKKEAIALARCVHSDKAGHKSAMDSLRPGEALCWDILGLED